MEKSLTPFLPKGKIGRWFHRRYTDINQFKSYDEFQAILDEFVTLDTIKQAIERAESIVQNNADNRKIKETHKGVTFYRDNPDVSVHEVVKLIFEVCEVK